MAPTKGTSKQKVKNVLPSIRRSKRIAAKFTVIKSNVERRHHGHHEASPSPTKRTKDCEILSLNDDCLLALFSFFSILELIDLRKCCSRFRALIDVAMPTRCRSETFHYIYKHKTHEKIMRYCGEFMQNVIFERNAKIACLLGNDSDSPATMWKWLRHCTALTSLTIRKMRPHYDHFSAKVYEGLENLEFDICYGNNIQCETIIRACKNLNTFRSNDYTFSPAMFNSFDTLEKIERISLRERFFPTPGNNLANLQTRKTLKYLEMGFWSDDKAGNDLDWLFNIDSLEHLVLRMTKIPQRLIEKIDNHKNMKSVQILYERLIRSFPSFIEKDFKDAIKTYDVVINRVASSAHNERYNIGLQRKQ